MTDTLTFDEAIAYVKSLDVYGSVLGLNNIKALASELDNPENGLKVVHITGTNGKGSVSAYLSNILKEAGYKVGTYNSPAVISDTDQFRINMDIISEELYAETVTLVKAACDRLASKGLDQPTRFEVETMIAFSAFYIEDCDVAVIETGLGGRDDATNISNNTILHIFASISMDHSAQLGDSLEKIASVKAGIIRSSMPVLLYDKIKSDNSENIKKAVNAIIRRAEEFDCEVYTVDDDSFEVKNISEEGILVNIKSLNCDNIILGMTGAYQPVNATIAVKAAKILSDEGYRISEDDICKALKNTFIPFRFEKLNICGTDIVLDGAHNEDGAINFKRSLEMNYPDSEFIFVTGIFKDKEYEKIAEATAKKAKSIIVIENKKSKRALNKDILKSVFMNYNNNVESADSIEEALEQALKKSKDAGSHSVICCFGSLSWLNDAKSYLYKLETSF